MSRADPSLVLLGDLREHARWADDRLAAILVREAERTEGAAREFGHLLAAYEIWCARLDGRPTLVEIWPRLAARDLEEFTDRTHASLHRHTAGLRPDDLARPFSYENSTGTRFTHTLGEVLTHMFLHGQYHRGKVALLVRQAGIDVPPSDFIAFVRARSGGGARGGRSGR